MLLSSNPPVSPPPHNNNSTPPKATTTTASTTTHFHRNQWFSAGLGRNARIVSWIVAFAGAGLWMYMEKKGEGKVTKFSIVDAKEWNDEVKQKKSKKVVSGDNNNESSSKP